LARIVYVSNGRGDTVTPIATAANTPGPPIPVGPALGEIVVTPDGRTAYVTTDDPLVVPIVNATGAPGPPISVGVNRPGLHDKPVALAITPDGKTAYAANIGSGTVTPIATATNTPGDPIEVGVRPRAIVITPDGRTAYVVNQSRPQPPPWHSYEAEKRGQPQPRPDPRGTVTPIDTATNTAGPPIPVGNGPWAIAVTPDSSTTRSASIPRRLRRSRRRPTRRARRSRSESGRMRSRSLPTAPPPMSPAGRTGRSPRSQPRRIRLARRSRSEGARAIAITPGGETAYVVVWAEPGAVVPIATATNTPGPPIQVGDGPYAIAIVP
jgi:YVTN family beta-propeller protein